MEDTSSTYGVIWDSTAVSDGSHTLYAIARDAAGNTTTSSSITVTVDNTAPVRSTGAPSSTLTLNTTSTAISLTTGEAATCRYSTTANTSYDSMILFTTTGNTSHSSTISGLSNGGSYTYYVKCQDVLGNTNTGDYSISFTVAADNTSPTVSITAPSNNTTVSGNSVTISANATDDVSVSGVQFYRNTNIAIGSEDTVSAYSVTWDSTAVTDGEYVLTAVARDSTNNTTTSSAITITVDNTAPVRSAATPTGTLSIGTTSTNISLTTNETATCKYSTTASTAYGSMTAFSTTNSTSHSSTISGLSNGGNYTYYVKCADVQNNTNATDYSIAFSVDDDTTPPTITNISSDKTNGSYTVGEVIDIDVTFSEVVTSTGNVTITLETGTTDRTCVFTVASATTGTCNYTVQSGDTSSDLTVASVSGTITDIGSNALINFTPATNLAANKAIMIDTTPPSIPASFTATVGSPTSTIDLAWTNPLDGDFASVTIRRSTLSYPTTITEGVSVAADVTGTTRADIGLTDGLYYYSIFARDATGNVSASANIVGIFDTVSPVLSSLSPSSVLSSGTTSTNIILTTDESSTCKYSTTASTAYGSMTAFSTTNSTSHLSAITGLANGSSYTYYVKCQDTLGNTNATDYAITFSIASAGGSGGDGGGGGYDGGSIIITQNPGTTVTVVPTPEALTDPADEDGTDEPSEVKTENTEENIPYTPNTTSSSLPASSFTYLSEDPTILTRLQSRYGADVVTEQTYKNQCETNEGKPYYRNCKLGVKLPTFDLFKESVVCE